MPSVFDLVGQLTFYGTYHTDSRNKAIHIIFVPVILWTSLVWLAYTGPLVQLNITGPFAHLIQGLVFNAAFFGVVVYGIYYILLERNIAGFVAAGLLVLGWITATSFYESNPQNAWKVALVFHLIGWVSQFLGHGLFENRKPALFDNLVNALLLAPLFVFLEVLFLFGYRPSLASIFHHSVEQNLKKLEKKGSKTQSKSKGKAKSGSKTPVQTQTKGSKQNQTKPTTKTPTKTQPKTQTKTQPKTQTKTQPKTQTKTQPKTQTKTQTKSQPQTQKQTKTTQKNSKSNAPQTGKKSKK